MNAKSMKRQPIALAAMAGLALVIAASNQAHSAVMFDGSYTQDFNSLPSPQFGNNNWTNDSTLPGWYGFREDGVGGNTIAYSSIEGEASGTGDESALHSRGNDINDPDRSLGASLYFEGYWIVLELTNDLGGPMDTINVTYTGEQWRVGNNASSASEPLRFAFSTDVGASLDAADIDPNPNSKDGDINTDVFTRVTSLDFNPPKTTPSNDSLDGNDAANRITLSDTITFGTSLADGETFYLLWNLTQNSRPAAMAIDDVSVTGTVIPEPASLALLGLGGLVMLRRRR